ncbi:MAG: YfhO family protein [Eubacterium sp.]|nr:YfhO family protein [Eubacterium sp.]
MKKLIMKKFKTNIWYITSSLIVLIFFVFFIFLHGIIPFGETSFITHDGFQQVYPFMCVLHDKMHSGENWLYYWNSGLGINFLSTYFFYLASPINLFLMFIDKSDILSFITFTIIIRLSLSAGTFGFYLSKKTESEKNGVIIVPLSCAYALSNFMLAYYHESMWLDSFVIFPIIMLGYDRLIKERKPALYAVSLSMAAYFNFYMVYIIGFFLCLWFVLDDHKSFKFFLKNSLWFCLTSFLSIGMSAMPLLVSYLGVQTTHVSEESILKHEWYGNIFEVFRYHFMFSKLQSIGTSPNYSNIFCGTFSIVLAMIYCFIKDISLSIRLKRIGLLLFMLVSMNESVLNYVWHAFHTPIFIPNRFGFAYIFVLLLMSKEAYDKINKESGKQILAGIVLAEIFPLICFVFVDFDSRIVSGQVLLVSMILISLYGIMCFCLSGNVKLKRIMSVILSLTMVVEILINAGYSLEREVKRKDYVGYIEPYSEIVKQIESKDDSKFYRSEFLNNEVFNLNSISGVNGLSVFSSLIPYMTYIFSNYSGIVSGDNAVGSYDLSGFMESLLGEKYLYVLKDKDFYSDRENYTLVDSDERINVYKNEEALGLGFGVSKDIGKFEYLYDEPFYFENELAVLMTHSEGIFDEYVPEYMVKMGKEYKFSNTRYIELINSFSEGGSRDVNISYPIDLEGEYYICLNLDIKNRVAVYVNDKLIRLFDENPAGNIFYIGNCKPGDDVRVDFHVLYDDEFESADQETIGFRTARVDKNAFRTFVNTARKNPMIIDSMNDSYIKAHVDIGKDQVLFTSIPFDKGWKVYDNGKEVSVKAIADAFVGIELTEGYHEIEFKYSPPGIIVGTVIMIFSWFIFAVLIILLRRHDKGKKL